MMMNMNGFINMNKKKKKRRKKKNSQELGLTKQYELTIEIDLKKLKKIQS